MPNNVFTPTPRDILIMRGLSLQVRLLGQRQLAETLWSGDVANARRRLKRLVQAGLLSRIETLAQPLPDLLRPVCSWCPGDARPDTSAVAHRLKSRWRYRALRPTVVYWATEFTKSHFGGRNVKPLPPQVTHDLGVAAVWLWYHQHHPCFARAWIGEDQLEEDEPGFSIPDAVIVNETQQTQMLIEFGGNYNAQRLVDFHEAAAARNVPYQVW